MDAFVFGARNTLAADDARWRVNQRTHSEATHDQD
jgi:hypothetical protein